ncbi:metallophosphoesterase [Dactylosporangium matsuzakiense]|uniref:3',5'-cyclic adenosine monophosphate phosphodiesterase CpdA n=1 Tax=Dactylosporangium matsuzakiense TaxID=53360 RepID=A0A9W6KEW9_9ACTN|nr:metallophosphoesterase [Dactylosporangium matsuzakiense]UWZ45241.1 metallophosphoesterase [Dactylosporangium matsuzakiense]GLK98789.1 3',5'-cyclic adenosine monophosphate phosphodiesterase CpdA [Dactylosporangium matsuzakiense]
MTLIAHVSDTHLDDGPRSAERVTRVVDYLAGLHTRVDAVLLTGDLADHGTADEYERLRGIFGRLDVPLLHLPGNHDRREEFVAAGLGPRNRAELVGDALFALVDSTIPGKDEGFIEDSVLAWLDATLDGDTPAFVCFHQPPVTVGQRFADGVRQFGEERLEAVIRRHPNVVAVLCGHFHTPTVTTFAGVPLVIAPGVTSTLIFPWEDPDGDVDLDAPPALAFHNYVGGRLTTTFKSI